MNTFLNARGRLARLTVLLLALGIAGCASAVPPGWTVLGERVVNDRAEVDTIHVGADTGRFSALQLIVHDAPITIRRVVIHFANGDTLVRRHNTLARRGLVSRRLDLPGERRVIRKVVFHYEASSPGFERGRVTLIGLR